MYVCVSVYVFECIYVVFFGCVLCVGHCVWCVYMCVCIYVSVCGCMLCVVFMLYIMCACVCVFARVCVCAFQIASHENERPLTATTNKVAWTHSLVYLKCFTLTSIL